MAEILGVVASAISVAQIAGQILSMVLKFKGLLYEVQDAPEAIGELIQQIEVLAPILCDIDHCQSQGVFPFLQSSNGLLQGALRHCQMSLDQLTDVVNDLSVRMESCRGIRRKMIALKMVLRQNLLARYERHLFFAVQLLSLAQQSYILYAVYLFCLVCSLTSFPMSSPAISDSYQVSPKTST